MGYPVKYVKRLEAVYEVARALCFGWSPRSYPDWLDRELEHLRTAIRVHGSAQTSLVDTVKDRIADPQIVDVELEDLEPVDSRREPCNHDDITLRCDLDEYECLKCGEILYDGPSVSADSRREWDVLLDEGGWTMTVRQSGEGERDWIRVREIPADSRLTRPFSETVKERIESDPEFADELSKSHQDYES